MGWISEHLRKLPVMDGLYSCPAASGSTRPELNPYRLPSTPKLCVHKTSIRIGKFLGCV